MSIRPVLGSRASIGGVLGSGRGGAAAWYLAGGVSAANCIAAYTPKGAVSLAASYDNNAAPGNGLADGTYDAAPGVAPTWAAATGWTFVNTSLQYLTTGITPILGYSMIVRFSDRTNTGLIAGTYGASSEHFYISGAVMGGLTGGYGGQSTNYAIMNGGVAAISDGKMYRDGAFSFNITPGTFATKSIYIGVGHGPTAGARNYYFSGKIQALAIYNVTLDAATVAAISAAMAAL